MFPIRGLAYYCEHSLCRFFLLKLFFYSIYRRYTSATRTSQIPSVIPSRQFFLIVFSFFNFKLNICPINNRMEIYFFRFGICQIELFQQRHLCPAGRIGTSGCPCPIVGNRLVAFLVRRIEITHFGFRHSQELLGIILHVERQAVGNPHLTRRHTSKLLDTKSHPIFSVEGHKLLVRVSDGLAILLRELH